jgi:hypothetical protein
VVTIDNPQCGSLGPGSDPVSTWRCVLQHGHEGPHSGAADITWTTEEESGQQEPAGP